MINNQIGVWDLGFCWALGFGYWGLTGRLKIEN